MRHLLSLAAAISLTAGAVFAGPAPEPLATLQIDTEEAPRGLAAYVTEGEAYLALSYGAGGFSIFNLDGEQLAHDPEPTFIVAPYRGHLAAFRVAEDDTRSLAVYAALPDGSFELQRVEEPSPIAPTTLQRTAFSALGPAQLAGEAIQLMDGQVHTGVEIAAIAATKSLPPYAEEPVVLVISKTGEVRAYDMADFRAAAGSK